MAVIGQDFPKSKNARREKLNEIKGNAKLAISTVKVPGHGMQNVYRIPLEYLSYNPYNTRFLAQAKTLETRIGRELSDERPEDVVEIEKFIWDYKKDKNESTIASLIKEGQLQPGVVTPSGLILSGNRRFRLLNEIQRNYKKYAKPGVNLDGLQYFEAAILDTDLSDKEIRKYESFYQYGNEDKVEYDPIQKYIAAKEQKELGYDEKEIADNFLTLSGGKESKVKEWLAEFELMEEYLNYIGEDGIYTALEQREEAFINLYKTLKSFKQGKAGKGIWAFDELDLEELKFRYFDYIWKNIATHEFREFPKIFSDYNRWQIFNSRVKKATSDQIASLDDYREQYKDESESTVSLIREKDYKKMVDKELNKALGDEKAVIINKETDETPWKLVDQIDERINKLELLIDCDSKEVKSEEFLQRVKEIMSHIGHIKQRID